MARRRPTAATHGKRQPAYRLGPWLRLSEVSCLVPVVGDRFSGIGVVVSRSRGGDCFPLSRPRSTIEIVGRSSARAAGWTLSRRGRIVGVRCCPSASSELTFAPRASRR